MKNWTDRFDEKFPHLAKPRDGGIYSCEKEVKQFISQERETAFEEGFKKGCKKTGTYEQGRLEALKEILPEEWFCADDLELEEMKDGRPYATRDYALGRNDSRQEIIDKIKLQK